jgi:NTE family protein
LKSFLAITNQTSSFLTRLNVLDQIDTLTHTDILITPDLEGVGTLNFAQFPEAVKRGTASAEKARDVLSRLSVSEEEYAAFRKKQRLARRDPRIDAVRVHPPPGLDPRTYQGVVRSKPGPMDWKVLEKDLGRLYEFGDFQTVDFHIEEEGGRSTLVFEGRPKPPAPTRLRLGLKLDTDFEANSSFGLRFGLYKTRLNALRGELRARMEVGERNGINFELYQPTGFSGRFFVAPTVGFLRSPVDTFVDDQVVASILIDHYFTQLDVGYSLGSLGEIRAGVRRDWGFVDTVVFTGAPLSDEVDVSAVTGRLRLDQVDSVTFPRRGWFVRSDVLSAGTVAGGTDSYNWMSAGGGFAKSFGESTVFGGIDFDTRLGGNDRPYYDQAAVGGFFRLSGLQANQIHGQYGGVARIIGYHRLARFNSLIGTGIYVGGSLETGNAWQNSRDIRFSNLRAAGSIYVGADTILGPLYLGYGLADRGSHSFYLALGLPLN